VKGRDMAARFGGEEFVIIFENCDTPRAIAIVDAARGDLATRKIVKKETGEPLGRVSFSGGVCSLEIGREPSEMLKIADRCLYAAKANGRNCIIPADR
jgi:diguanylate cyclase